MGNTVTATGTERPWAFKAERRLVGQDKRGSAVFVNRVSVMLSSTSSRVRLRTGEHLAEGAE